MVRDSHSLWDGLDWSVNVSRTVRYGTMSMYKMVSSASDHMPGVRSSWLCMAAVSRVRLSEIFLNVRSLLSYYQTQMSTGLCDLPGL